MMRVLKWIGIVLGGLLVLGVGGITYARSAAQKRFAAHYQIDVPDLPMPFPLSESELTQLREEAAKAAEPAAAPAPTAAPAPAPAGKPAAGGAELTASATAEVSPQPAKDPLEGVDLKALAEKRALERGRHYIESRAGCAHCHGADFGGNIIVENPALGRWVGPNITRGGLTKDYTGKDWLRLVRHGVKPDGTAATMPCTDFTWFSDQEISDIGTYITSLPAVSKAAPESSMGPVFAILVLKGDFKISAEVIDHKAPRSVYPPAIKVSTELGQHLVATCTGCHGEHLSGGPIRGGDPAWVPARNLTFHESGLASWSLADFENAMRTGVRPDGSKIGEPMPIAYTQKLNSAEIESMYLYLKQQAPRPYGTY
jgi:cytochrome c553